MKKSIRSSLMLLSILMLGPFTPVSAEEGWKHTLVPLYLWATGVEGSAQIGSIEAPVSINFEDALDNLDTAFTVHYEARKGRWGMLVDIFHLSLAPEGLLPNGVPLGVSLTNNIYELGGTYRPDAMNGVDVIFGLRGVDFELEASVSPVAKTSLANETWVDGFVGLRANIGLSDKFSFMVRGDVGTGASDFVGNAVLILDYRFNKNVSMFGGYRWLTYDYETGSGRDHFAYDVTYEGPAIALRFDW